MKIYLAGEVPAAGREELLLFCKVPRLFSYFFDNESRCFLLWMNSPVWDGGKEGISYADLFGDLDSGS